jgi:hypothetical protein
MYVRIGNLEILDSYLSGIEIGDTVSVEALVRNPLDWHHFYENLTSIKPGNTTHFTVVTRSGERIVGIGNIAEIDKWSNKGQFGFKIKLRTIKHKSASTKRTQLQTSFRLEDKILERSLEIAAK